MNWLLFIVVMCFWACSGDEVSSEDGESSCESCFFVDSVTDDFKILASRERIAEFVGRDKFKLVFRNENTGNLVYLNYSDSVLKFREFVTELDCYHPEISPDGRWVAFSTACEKTDFASDIYVLDLNSEQTRFIKLDAENAVIPRWRIFANGDTGLVFVNRALLNKLDAWKTSATLEVPFMNGQFGTPKVIFSDGAFHGGISADGSFAVTSATRLIVRKTDGSGVYKDEFWYNDGQTCNASLFMDGSNRVLFLDLASPEGVKFVGHEYLAHQNILVADSTGKLLKSFPSTPEMVGGQLMETAFDHTEWVVGDILIADMVNVLEMLRRKIMLINMADSTQLDLIECEGDMEFWHPSMWVGAETSD